MYPCASRCAVDGDVDGLMENHAGPACRLPLTCMTVSSAIRSWPLAYQTVSGRVSDGSSEPSCSLDGPIPVKHCTARQSRSGTGPSFCAASGASPYTSDDSNASLRLSAGCAESSEAVLLRLYMPIVFEKPVKFVGLASAPAVEDTKYSLPLFAVANALPGTAAGHTVKPGTLPPADESDVLLKCSTGTDARPAASLFLLAA